MTPEALLGFLARSDALKHVERAAFTGPRRENAAEHSWQVALVAVLLHPAAPAPRPDLARILALIAAHDLVEIEAGDSFAFDAAAALTQAAREADAATRLPPELAALWREFEDGTCDGWTRRRRW